ncbi:hypothetical protein C8R43DRAFT_864114, partial [Mycena crocata]
PAIQDAAVFGVEWWGWWREINPEWRASTDAALLRAEGGDWSALSITGINGFLSVLACLLWWGVALGGGERKDWDAAVSDVTWALEEIVK